jgi:hypothetical protein
VCVCVCLSIILFDRLSVRHPSSNGSNSHEQQSTSRTIIVGVESINPSFDARSSRDGSQRKIHSSSIRIRICICIRWIDTTHLLVVIIVPPNVEATLRRVHDDRSERFDIVDWQSLRQQFEVYGGGSCSIIRMSHCFLVVVLRCLFLLP